MYVVKHGAETMKKATTIFLGFRNGQLITIVESVIDNFESAIDVDYVITNPENAEKQIAEWKKRVEAKQ